MYLDTIRKNNWDTNDVDCYTNKCLWLLISINDMEFQYADQATIITDTKYASNTLKVCKYLLGKHKQK